MGRGQRRRSRLRRAREALDLLVQIRKNPQSLRAQVDAAEAQYRAAEAAVAQAQAALDGLLAGATPEEIAALEAQVQQAQAQLESARTVLAKLTLTAPVGGQVVEVVGHAGELASPGITLITLADLEEVTLKVYIPENRLGQVQVGQQVEVRVDSFPDRVFIGRVASIATEAEFTPATSRPPTSEPTWSLPSRWSSPTPTGPSSPVCRPMR